MLDVLLTTEGTYPYHRGGVGTWCDILVRQMSGVRFHIMPVIGNPFIPVRFQLPPQVASFTPVPLWGTEEPAEYLNQPYKLVYDRKALTTPAAVEAEFMPMVDRLLDQIWLQEQDGAAFARLVRDMYQLFQTYDYLNLFKSERVWDRYKTRAIRRAEERLGPEPCLRDLVQGLGWVYRFLTVLTAPVPRVDVAHSSAAAFCSLPALVAKLEYGAPMLLTEHGVYLREQYLSVGRSDLTPFGKSFLLGLVGAVSRAAFWATDQVSPVAAYNLRWERRLGVPEHKCRVIYNGVDPLVFQPRPRPEGAPLTVVSVARIDPIKDLETLLRAAAIVRAQMPQVKFVVYGGISVPAYYERLLDLRKELGLEAGFVFAGHVDTPAAAYQSGDIVALSSISEGFPYAVVESMMSGRPVVATDVGGTAEALGETGFLVPPEDPRSMAEALLRLLSDGRLRQQLAEETRERALTHFTLHRQIEQYRQSYEALAARSGTSVRLRLQLLLERAEALSAIGDTHAALGQLRLALNLDPAGAAAPLILLRMAQLHLHRQELEQALLCSERAELLSRLGSFSAA